LIKRHKYDKCPKGTPYGWEHHTLCKVCLGENVGNTVVKLGCSDSTQVLVNNFLQHHKEEWEKMHKENQSSITFTSRDSTGKSTRPSPLRTPTPEQCILVDETRQSVKRLFVSIASWLVTRDRCKGVKIHKDRSTEFVYYESLKREIKTKTIYGCRCDERLKN
jgi:hypothetical protein